MRQRRRQFRVFVEGGGNGNAPLRKECCDGFAALLRKVGLEGRMPAIIPAGSRLEAYQDFRHALEDAADGDVFVLLVDAEQAITAASPWQHLHDRVGDKWTQPEDATDDHCHLMAQCMETWLVADAEAFAKFFGSGFKANQMPARSGPALEQEPKLDLYAKIAAATADCKTKAQYGKGAHSFKLLALVDPAKVRQLPWADRFFTYLLKVA